MTAVPDMRWNSPQPEWSTIMSWDASDGRILSADSEVIDKGYRASQGSAGTSQNGTAASQNAAGTSQTTPGGVSIETAKQTVMDRIPGIDAGNIYIHPDYDDGISLYEGEAYYAEVKYEFEINAENGNIISWEAEFHLRLRKSR